MQWCVLSAVHCIDVCPTVQEKELRHPREGGGGERGRRREWGEGRRKSIQKSFVIYICRQKRMQSGTHHSCLHALLTGKVEGSGAVVVRSIDQCSVLYQDLNHFSVV